MSPNSGLSRPHVRTGVPLAPSVIGLKGDYLDFPWCYHHFWGKSVTQEKAQPDFCKICDVVPYMDGRDTQVCSQANQRLHVKESVMSTSTFVCYFRVSTIRQGTSGLGLEAQRGAAIAYCAANAGEILAEFTEVESGKKNQRPKLKAAIEMCRKTGATLLIAKVDRLARKVHFVSGLMDSGVRFVAADLPNADRFMMHVYAAMAEEEGRRISERTRAALASAKARGIKLGVNGIALAAKHKEAADEFAKQIGPLIRQLIQTEGMTFASTAETLNAMGVAPARGTQWHSTSVHRVHHRFASMA